MQPLSSSSRRRTALSDCASTTEDSIKYPRRIGILYPSFLTSLTPQVRDAHWNFSEDCRRSFNRLKEAFTTAPILTHYQPGALITIETDASDYVIAGILSIACSDGEIQLVAFYSHTLTVPELNYDTHDKELLAIFEAFKTW